MSLEPLADETFVIRGGLMEIVPLRIAIEACRRRAGFYGLSFCGENSLSVPEITRLTTRLPQPRIRVSTIGRLRALGYELYRSGPRPHLTLKFEISPTDSGLKELVGAFGPDIPNPHPST